MESRCGALLLLLALAVAFCESSKVHHRIRFSSHDLHDVKSEQLRQKPVATQHLGHTFSSLCTPVGRRRVLWCRLEHSFPARPTNARATNVTQTGNKTSTGQFYALRGDDVTCFMGKAPYGTEFYIENVNGITIRSLGLNVTIFKDGNPLQNSAPKISSVSGSWEFRRIPQPFEVNVRLANGNFRQMCSSFPPPPPCTRHVFISCCFVATRKRVCKVILQLIRNPFCKMELALDRKEGYYKEPAGLHMRDTSNRKKFNEYAEIFTNDQDKTEVAKFDNPNAIARLLNSTTDTLFTYMPIKDFPKGFRGDPAEFIDTKSDYSSDFYDDDQDPSDPEDPDADKLHDERVRKRPKFCIFGLPAILRSSAKN